MAAMEGSLPDSLGLEEEERRDSETWDLAGLARRRMRPRAGVAPAGAETGQRPARGWARRSRGRSLLEPVLLAAVGRPARAGSADWRRVVVRSGMRKGRRERARGGIEQSEILFSRHKQWQMGNF